VPWGACPEHGATLRSTAGRCWCTTPGCLRRWFHDRLAEPCAEPVTHRVIDAEGDRSISATVTPSTPAPASSAPR
jgi:hypothetical protein